MNKWKISTVILTILLVLVSCETNYVDASDNEEFKMELVSKYSSWSDDLSFRVYVDTYSDVEYLVVRTKDGGISITPRLMGSQIDK